MTETLRIPLSVHQQVRFRQLAAESEQLAIRKNESVTAIIAGLIDPVSIKDWNISLEPTEIVCVSLSEVAS